MCRWENGAVGGGAAEPRPESGADNGRGGLSCPGPQSCGMLTEPGPAARPEGKAELGRWTDPCVSPAATPVALAKSPNISDFQLPFLEDGEGVCFHVGGGVLCGLEARRPAFKFWLSHFLTTSPWKPVDLSGSECLYH